MKKYTSMLNVYNKDLKALTEKHYGLPCVCLNKIHGMNVQIEFIPKSDSNKTNDFDLVNIYGREDLITAENDEYGIFKFITTLNFTNSFIPYIHNLIEVIKEKELLKDEVVESLSIFGEFFGGVYDHKNVPKCETCQKIQRGVHYSPCNNIILFDIYIKSNKRNCYLDWINIERLFSEANINYPDIIFSGTLQECIDFDPVFLDPTYKKYNLPAIKDNYSEGIVIRPIKESNFGYNFGGDRLILKNKYKKFDERQKQQNREANRIARELESQIHLKEFDIALEYINTNRLDNCFSHLNIVKDIKNFPALMKEFNIDVLKDFKLDNDILHLTKDENKLLNKFINKKASELVRQYLMEVEV
jgi:RNA ligase.